MCFGCDRNDGGSLRASPPTCFFFLYLCPLPSSPFTLHVLSFCLCVFGCPSPLCRFLDGRRGGEEGEEKRMGRGGGRAGWVLHVCVRVCMYACVILAARSSSLILPRRLPLLIPSSTSPASVPISALRRPLFPPFFVLLPIRQTHHLSTTTKKTVVALSSFSFVPLILLFFSLFLFRVSFVSRVSRKLLVCLLPYHLFAFFLPPHVLCRVHATKSRGVRVYRCRGYYRLRGDVCVCVCGQAAGCLCMRGEGGNGAAREGA